MSRLRISSRGVTYSLNVVAFSSPLFQTIASAQTRWRAVHFPIKVSQPEIKFDVVFANENDFERFQQFVRTHQRNMLITQALVTLNWPARDINNWTGIIPKFQAGGERRNYAPRASFQVELVDSMVSSRTELASRASSWRAIYGGLGVGGLSAADSVLTVPSLGQSGSTGVDFGGANPLAAGYVSTPAGF